MRNKFSNESTYKKFCESGREAEFDKLFEDAAKSVVSQFGKKYPMYINGREEFSAENIIEKTPIDNTTIIGYFQKGTKESAKAAIEAAYNAFQTWSKVSYIEKVAIFRKVAQIFSKNKFELAAVLSYENGKSRYESIGEVDEAIDFMNYYSNEVEINKGYIRKTKMEASTAKVEAGFQGAPSTKEERVVIRMMPYGVFGVIAPFNFPLSIGTGMSVGAMITGNTVVFKPSSSDSMTMLTGIKMYQYFKEAGVPDGVFNYVSGPGSAVGEELVTNPHVSGIAFTGSREVGASMIAKAYSLGLQKTFIVEMGGKNPTIVSKNADLDKAASAIVSAAFGFDGQKCSATSRVYVHESVKEQFISKLIEKARGLKVGDPIKKENYIGPLISKNAYNTYMEAIGKAKIEGRILYGGNKVDINSNAYYVEPTIIEVKHSSDLVQRELFVPVLTVESYKEFDDAIKMANDIKYGLTAALYSKKKKEIQDFIDGIEAGTVYINRQTSSTTGAIVGLHTFVGWKASSINGKGSGSKFYLQQFMREQSVSLTR